MFKAPEAKKAARPCCPWVLPGTLSESERRLEREGVLRKGLAARGNEPLVAECLVTQEQRYNSFALKGLLAMLSFLPVCSISADGKVRVQRNATACQAIGHAAGKARSPARKGTRPDSPGAHRLSKAPTSAG
jgi:hypothetical protein